MQGLLNNDNVLAPRADLPPKNTTVRLEALVSSLSRVSGYVALAVGLAGTAALLISLL